MARVSKNQVLNIWANGDLVGQWQVSSQGVDTLIYDSTWLTSKFGRPISLSLPCSINNGSLQGPEIYNYFENLLPDSDLIRRRIQARFRTPNTGAFELLNAIGRDCVGALQLLPVDQKPHAIRKIEAQPLSDHDIANILKATSASPSSMRQGDDLDEDFRISIAGAQEKTALLWHQGRWCRPLGATPTTHIFKLPLGLIGNRQADMRTSVENEWLCSKIIHQFGLPVASSEIMQFEDQKTLVVERFDRRLTEQNYWLRLPQEDFCQVMGISSETKYQSDGGPSLIDVAKVLQQSENRDQDLKTLLKAQLLFWLMAATDGHAKNFSIFILPGGRFCLTPLYDVLSAWPVTGLGTNKLDQNRLRLAMAIRGKNNHYRLKDIQRRHFNHTARLCGWGDNMENIISEVLEQLPEVLSSVKKMLPSSFPEEIFMSIESGIQISAKRLLRMADA